MTYDASTITALQSGALILRDLLYVSGWDSGGSPATWGFWTGADDVSVSVVGALTGTPVSRNYIGGGTLLEVPPIVDAIGIESRSVDFELSQIESNVQDMVRANTIRGGRVELHRGVFSPSTWALVSTPFARFVGRVDTARITTPPAGGTGSIVLSCSDDRVDLTRINPALKSDETQKLRNGDRIRRYNDTAAEVSIWWGQAKGKADTAAKTAKSGSQGGNR